VSDELGDEKFVVEIGELVKAAPAGDSWVSLHPEDMLRLLSLAELGVKCKELGKRARAIYDCMTRYLLPRPYLLLTEEDALTLLRELAERCEAVGGEKGEGG